MTVRVEMLSSVTLLLLLSISQAADSNLAIGFYGRSCPKAEEIVTSVVRATMARNPRIGPILLRLHFHDCFVDGCDGSILLQHGETSEMFASGHLGVGGSAVIDTAKSELEKVCKGVVSCADIVALAARDAVHLSYGPFYRVPTGRRDGRVSEAKHAANFPDVDDPIGVLKAKFHRKGLSDEDLVLLTAGAHTIGTTDCLFMNKRLFNFSSTTPSDPSINPAFLQRLKKTCPAQGSGIRIPLDPVTKHVFDISFNNLKKGIAVLSSDARLMDNPSTRRVVESLLLVANPEQSFEKAFVKSVVKMGRIGVLTGSRGEIRTVCSSVNF